MYTMADYETNAHTMYFSTSYQLTPKLLLNGMVTYNMSEGGLQEVVMPDVTDRLVDSEGNPALTHQDFDFEHMPDYSDLDYEILRLHAGAEYRLTDRITFTADGDYADLTDNQAYVYGNETGSYFMIRSGFRFGF